METNQKNIDYIFLLLDPNQAQISNSLPKKKCLPQDFSKITLHMIVVRECVFSLIP